METNLVREMTCLGAGMESIYGRGVWRDRWTRLIHTLLVVSSRHMERSNIVPSFSLQDMDSDTNGMYITYHLAYLLFK